jgi:hypothetical protein
MMKVLQYFEVDNKEHWLNEIAKSNWDAAHYLHYLLKEHPPSNFSNLVIWLDNAMHS